MSTLQWIGVGCLAVGAVCVLGSVHALWRRHSLWSKGVATEGTVIDVQETVASWGKTREATVRYTPTVRYRDLSGQTYERRLTATGDRKRFEVGANVWLLYDVKDPANVIDPNTGFRDVTTKLVMSLLLCGLGVLLYLSFAFTPKS